MKVVLSLFLILLSGALLAQSETDNNGSYKKRVLESAEVEFLMNYYDQSGENAAVTGGKGTEDLQDLSPTILVSVPLNDDDVLTVQANISAYSSASSSNPAMWRSVDLPAPEGATRATTSPGAITRSMSRSTRISPGNPLL